jgi:orotate phosphoribosyltransferase
LPKNIEVIVGIPRSGLFVANLLSLYLNLPLADLEGFVNLRMLDGGQRCPFSSQEHFLKKRRNVLVIDDSLFTGTQMQQARDRIHVANLPHNVCYAAVYVIPENKTMVDFFYECVPWPRMFEWNFMHHGDMPKWCVDIDGVLCRDPTDEENDDGEKYLRFLKNVEPLIIPSVPVGWLVTCRLEKYRQITEAWLAKHGVKYEKLMMMNFPNKEARVASGSHSSFKASIYKETQAMLFIESSFKQAIEIARLSGKNVLCIENREMIYPSSIARSMQRKRQFLHLLREDPIGAIKEVFGFIARNYLKKYQE